MTKYRRLYWLGTLLFLSGCQVEFAAWLAGEWQDACPSAEHTQVDILLKINQFRQTSRTCGGEVFATATELQWHTALAQASQLHADDMAKFDFVSHRGSDGSSPELRLQWAGYTAKNSNELLAKDFSTTAEVMTYWQTDASVCATLMNPALQHVGAACNAAWNSGSSRAYWALLLAAR